MPPPHKGNTSGFAAAAKVLFDSAQRVGAVQPLEHSSKQYAHQLKKIQLQSKKRGGSLGGVSYKVAEFLAAQRPHVAQQTDSLPVRERTIAKKVPLIDIPSVPVKPIVKLTTPDDAASAQKIRTPPRSVPSLSSLLSKVPISSTEPTAPSPPLATPPQVVNTDIAEPHDVEDLLITEDKPLFEIRHPTLPEATSEAIVRPSVATKPTVSPPDTKRAKPVIVVPIAVDSAGTAAVSLDEEADGLNPHEATTRSSFSVDAWERQREHELERLQQKQDEEEQRRFALLREQEYQTLGKEWVARRTETHTFAAELSASDKMLREVYYAESGSSALARLQQMIDTGTRSSALLPTAVSYAAYRIKASNPTEQSDLKSALLEMVVKAKLPDAVMRKAHLAVSSGADFLAAYGALTPQEKQRLDGFIILKAVRALMGNGKWEEAIELARQSRSNFHRGSEALDLTLLKWGMRLDEEPRKEVITYASRSLTEQGRMGRTAKLLIARAEKGTYRRTLLRQMTATSDVDESIYAELIVRSDKEQTAELLAEMTNRGLNAEDPVVLGAVAMKKLGADSPEEVFKEIDRQVSMIGLREIHVYVAIKAAALCPTKEMLTLAVALVQRIPPQSRGIGLRRILPLLYQHGMMDEIVALADATNNQVPITKLIRRAMAFVNEALLKMGRAPVNDLRCADIGYRITSTGETAGGLPGDGDHPTTMIVDISGLTEKMLLYAKERQWAKSLEIVQGLPTSPRAEPSAVTLLYNCALSAAVEHPETVKSIHALMSRRGVTMNSTTVNTVLSSLSKSSLWEEALDFFDAVPLPQRDNNTYLIYFSLLGKNSLWKEAIEAYREMRQTVSKPPAALFSLVISTTAAQDWQATLQVFHDMLKIHGASVKDSVITQVIRSLEQHNRQAELAKLEKDLAKRKKKK